MESSSAGKANPSSFLKRHFLNLLVVIVALLVTFLVIEIGFRVWIGVRATKADPVVRMGNIVRPSADRDLVYEYIPNSAHANSAGMRGPEVSREKPPNTIRIAGLGDSVMAADLYKADQSFIAVLGDLLNEATTGSARRYETLNFSVGGYNMYQESIMLRRRALAYDPDFVVLGVVINDTERPVYYQVRDRAGNITLRDRYQDEKRRPDSEGLDLARLPWWAHSVFARFVHYRLTAKRRFLEGFDYMHAAFADIARACRERKTPLLAVAFTEFAERGQTEDPRAEWHAIVRKMGRQENVPLLELYPQILKYLEENNIPSYRKFWSGPLDAHPNPEGHRLIGRLIFQRLREMGVLRATAFPR
jgi:lysophospholipase L1-like esterase